MEAENLIEEIRAMFPGNVEGAFESAGDPVLVVRREVLRPLAAALQAEPFRYEMLLDLTCVDFVASEQRLELVYHLFSVSRNRRLRIKASLPESDPWAESLTGLWKNADWLEREVFDLFGVRFEGHPDLRRILMYEGFEGHPLRKSYPWRREQPLVRQKG